MKKRGYFFTIDVFIAGMVLFSTIYIIYSIQTVRFPTTQTEKIGNDLFRYLLTTTVEDSTNAYLATLKLNSSVFTRDDFTLLEEICALYALNMTTEMRNLTKNITEELVPEQFSYRVEIINLSDSTQNYMLYNRSKIKYQDSFEIIPKKRIMLGNINLTEKMGPYVVRTVVWR